MKKLLRSAPGVLACLLAFGLTDLSAAPKKAKFPAGQKVLMANTQNSTVKWTGKKVTGQHNGVVKLKSGQVAVQDGKLVGGEFVVDMATIEDKDLDSGSKAKLEGHLKSDDFFGVAKHPTAKFVITGVSPVQGNEKANYEITGDLTIKGITHPLTFPAWVVIKDGTAEAKASLSVDRTLYDIRYGSGKFFENLGDKTIYDEFLLDLYMLAG